MNKGGRPRHKLPENYEQILWQYMLGEIGRRECSRLLNLSSLTKFTDCWFFRDFLKRYGIKSFRNNVDLWASNKYKDRDNTNKICAKIFYEDGREEVRYVS